MAVELAEAYVSLTASADGIGKSILKELGNNVDGAAAGAGDRASKGFLSRFGSGLGGLGLVLGGAFAAAGVVTGGFLKGAIGEASGLNEAVSKAGRVFEDATPKIMEMAETSATSLGISKAVALDTAGTFGNLFRAMGLTTEASADMSIQLLKNSADLASFNNADPEEVLLALRAGLTGETEPLRRFGININDARLKAEAFRLGLVEATVDQKKLSTAQETADKAARKVGEALKKYGEGSVQYSDAVRDAEQANTSLAEVLEGKLPESLTAAQKAQAAFSLIQQDSTIAQDDFALTADGLANSGRTLSAMWKDLKAAIGTAFLPIAVQAATFLRDRLFPALTKASAAVEPFIATVRAAFDAFRSGGDGEGAVGFAARLGDGFRTVVGVLRDIDWRAAFGAAVDFMRPIVEFARQIVRSAIDIGKTLAAVDWRAVFDRAVEILTPVVEGLLKVRDAAFDLATKALPPLVDLFNFLVFTVLPPVVAVVAPIAAVLGDILGGALKLLAPLISLVADNLDILIPVLATAGAAFVAFKTATAVAGAVGTVTSAISTLNGVASTFGVSFSRAALEAGKQTETFGKISSAFDGLKGKLSQLGGALKTAATNVVNFAKTAATQAVAGIKAAATAVANWAKQLGLWIKQAVIATATAVKQAAVWVAQKVAMIATTVATQAQAAAQWALNAAMNANPIGLIIAGLAALTAGLVLAYRHSETFRGIVDAIGRFFRDTLWPAIVDIASAVGGFLVDAFNAVKGALDAVWPVLQAIGEFVGRVLTAYFEAYRSVLSTVIDVVVEVAKAVGGFLSDAFSTARDILNQVWPVVERVADFLGNVLRTAIGYAVNGVRDVINWFAWLIDAAGNVYTSVSEKLGAVVDFITGMPGKISSAASGMWDGIKEAFRSSLNWIINKWNGLKFSIPSIDVPGFGKVGGATLAVPQITPFADGGVVNSPTLALLGEVQRARPEIVAPEPVLRKIVGDELARAGGRGVTFENHFHDARVRPDDVSRALAWQFRTGG